MTQASGLALCDLAPAAGHGMANPCQNHKTGTDQPKPSNRKSATNPWNPDQPEPIYGHAAWVQNPAKPA